MSEDWGLTQIMIMLPLKMCCMLWSSKFDARVMDLAPITSVFLKSLLLPCGQLFFFVFFFEIREVMGDKNVKALFNMSQWYHGPVCLFPKS